MLCTCVFSTGAAYKETYEEEETRVEQVEQVAYNRDTGMYILCC
jgi:hypothetical protein